VVAIQTVFRTAVYAVDAFAYDHGRHSFAGEFLPDYIPIDCTLYQSGRQARFLSLLEEYTRRLVILGVENIFRHRSSIERRTNAREVDTIEFTIIYLARKGSVEEFSTRLKCDATVYERSTT